MSKPKRKRKSKSKHSDQCLAYGAAQSRKTRGKSRPGDAEVLACGRGGCPENHSGSRPPPKRVGPAAKGKPRSPRSGAPQTLEAAVAAPGQALVPAPSPPPLKPPQRAGIEAKGATNTRYTKPSKLTATCDCGAPVTRYGDDCGQCIARKSRPEQRWGLGPGHHPPQRPLKPGEARNGGKVAAVIAFALSLGAVLSRMAGS